MARIGLPVAVWLYFGLNFAFFRIPWPWKEWTGRTPSGIIFFVCAACPLGGRHLAQQRRPGARSGGRRRVISVIKER